MFIYVIPFFFLRARKKLASNQLKMAKTLRSNFHNYCPLCLSSFQQTGVQNASSRLEELGDSVGEAHETRPLGTVGYF